MTNFEKIKSMTLEELAKFNLRYTVEMQLDYDYEENAYEYPEDVIQTSDGTTFYSFNEHEALEYERLWLQSEVEEEIEE